MEGDNVYSVRFVELVRKGDLSEVISEAELASIAVQFLRSVDLSEIINDAELASMALQFLRSVYQRFVELDGFAHERLKDGRKKPSLDDAREFMQEVQKSLIAKAFGEMMKRLEAKKQKDGVN